MFLQGRSSIRRPKRRRSPLVTTPTLVSCFSEPCLRWDYGHFTSGRIVPSHRASRDGVYEVRCCSGSLHALVTHCIRTFLGGRMLPGPIPCRNIRIPGHLVLVLRMQMSDQTARAQELPRLLLRVPPARPRLRISMAGPCVVFVSDVRCAMDPTHRNLVLTVDAPLCKHGTAPIVPGICICRAHRPGPLRVP